IKPGDGAHSRLVHLVAGIDPDLKMPPKGPPLTPVEISRLRSWIDQGAAVPQIETTAATSAGLDPSSIHWSFQPIRRPTPPRGAQPSGVRNGIDSFVLGRLEAASIAPAPEADKVTLLRRLSLDLLGLPASPKEVAEFLNDVRPDAHERLVDRLLASPHYG